MTAKRIFVTIIFIDLLLVLPTFLFAQQPPKVKLMHAVSDGDIEAVKELLEDGVSPDRADYFDDSPLYRALANGYPKIAELLVRYGADPNVGSSFGPGGDNIYTHPLWISLRRGYGGVADLLIEHGAEQKVVEQYYEATLYTFLKNGLPGKAAPTGSPMGNQICWRCSSASGLQLKTPGPCRTTRRPHRSCRIRKII